MTKKITIYGLDPEMMARDVANALQQNFGGIMGVRVEVEDMTPEEEERRFREIMLAGPNEIFGRNGAPSALPDATEDFKPDDDYDYRVAEGTNGL